jgi:uncharacterized protein (TIGR02996 family)
MLYGETEFVKAIIASPGDDVIRMAYSDWLEEQQDPRTEYIRLQLEIGNRIANGVDPEELFARYRSIVRATDQSWRHFVGKRFELVVLGFKPGYNISFIKSMRKVLSSRQQNSGLGEAVSIVNQLPKVICSGWLLEDAIAAQIYLEECRHEEDFDWLNTIRNTEMEACCEIKLRSWSGYT